MASISAGVLGLTPISDANHTLIASTLDIEYVQVNAVLARTSSSRRFILVGILCTNASI